MVSQSLSGKVSPGFFIGSDSLGVFETLLSSVVSAGRFCPHLAPWVDDSASVFEGSVGLIWDILVWAYMASSSAK